MHIRLLSSVRNNVLISLVDLNLIEYAGREHLHHVVPDIHSQILCGASRQEAKSSVWRNEPIKVMKSDMLHFLYSDYKTFLFCTCVKLVHNCGLLRLCVQASEARSGRRTLAMSAYSPNNGGKIWDVFIQVFVVQRIHNDFL